MEGRRAGGQEGWGPTARGCQEPAYVKPGDSLLLLLLQTVTQDGRGHRSAGGKGQLETAPHPPPWA